MARYSAQFTIAGVNAVDAVLFSLETAASDRAFIRQVFFGIEVAPTSAPAFGLKRRNAAGVTPTTTTPFSHDSADGTPASTFQTGWATRPTVTGGSVRRGWVPLAVGNGFLFDFRDSPLVVPVSAGICGVNLIASGATVGTFGGFVEWDE